MRTRNLQLYTQTFKGEFENRSLAPFYATGATGNCQMKVIQYAEALFNPNAPTDEIRSAIRSLKQEANIILLDIRNEVYDQVKLFFHKSYIKINERYVSTNGSVMRIMLIRIEDWDLYKNEIDSIKKKRKV